MLIQKAYFWYCKCGLKTVRAIFDEFCDQIQIHHKNWDKVYATAL